MGHYSKSLSTGEKKHDSRHIKVEDALKQAICWLIERERTLLTAGDQGSKRDANVIVSMVVSVSL